MFGDALAPHHRFGFERDAVAAGELDLRAAAAARRRARGRPGRPRSRRGSRRAARTARGRTPRRTAAGGLRDDQPLPPVLRHVAAFGRRRGSSPACVPPSCAAHQVEEAERILPHQLGDRRRGHGEQLASGRDRLHACPRRRTALTRRQRVVTQQQQLAVGEPAEVARACRRCRCRRARFPARAAARRPRRRSRRRSRRSAWPGGAVNTT